MGPEAGIITKNTATPDLKGRYQADGRRKEHYRRSEGASDATGVQVNKADRISETRERAGQE